MNEDFKKLSDLVGADSTQLQKLYDLALIASLDEMKRKFLRWGWAIVALMSAAAALGIIQFVGAEVKRAEAKADSIEEMESTLVRNLQEISPVVKDWIAAEENPRLWAAVNYLVADF